MFNNKWLKYLVYFLMLLALIPFVHWSLEMDTSTRGILMCVTWYISQYNFLGKRKKDLY